MLGFSHFLKWSVLALHHMSEQLLELLKISSSRRRGIMPCQAMMRSYEQVKCPVLCPCPYPPSHPLSLLRSQVGRLLLIICVLSEEWEVCDNVHCRPPIVAIAWGKTWVGTSMVAHTSAACLEQFGPSISWVPTVVWFRSVRNGVRKSHPSLCHHPHHWRMVGQWENPAVPVPSVLVNQQYRGAMSLERRTPSYRHDVSIGMVLWVSVLCH